MKLSSEAAKSKILTARKSSTGKLGKLFVTHRPKDNSRTSVNRSISRHVMVPELRQRKEGRSTSLLVSAASCDAPPVRPQRRSEHIENTLKATPKMTFDNEELDSPPTKPQRLPSVENDVVAIGEFDYMNYGCSSSLSKQRNADFGETPIKAPLCLTLSSFWGDLRPAEPSKANSPMDKPPSYCRRETSVTALESFSAINIKGSSTCLEAVAKNNGEGKDCPACSKSPCSSNSHMPASMRVRTGDQPSNQQHPNPTQVSPCQEPTIRGMYETWSWIQRDFYLPVSCSRCSTELTCIKDVDSVLCSSCGAISPVVSTGSRPQGGGLGLGLTFRDLRRCEVEGPVL